MAQLKKVLYVDDDPSVCELVEVVLELTGDLEVRICHSGQEAVSLSRTFKPELIVMDVNMPGMDGPTTFSTLKRNGVQVPVVFATAETNPEELQKLWRQGPEEILIKPFDPHTLSTRLKTIWRAAHRAEFGGEAAPCTENQA